MMTGLLLCFLLGLLPGIASAPVYPITAPVEIRREPLFDGPVLHWEVQVRRADLAKLRKSGGPWNRENDPDASATCGPVGKSGPMLPSISKGRPEAFVPWMTYLP